MSFSVTVLSYMVRPVVSVPILACVYVCVACEQGEREAGERGSEGETERQRGGEIENHRLHAHHTGRRVEAQLATGSLPSRPRSSVMLSCNARLRFPLPSTPLQCVIHH